MQALGSYDGGRMLFIGLGTGLGSAIVSNGIAEPLELAHLPFRDGTFEDYVGERSLEQRGKKKWRKLVFEVVEILARAMQCDYVVIGGGGVKELDQLPPNSRRGNNELAFLGGYRLWDPDWATTPAAGRLSA
jgi:polyphosphate glucokinase